MKSKTQADEFSITDRVRRSRGRLARNTVVSTKVTKFEREELNQVAEREGKALSEWTRDVLLERARRGRADTALFTELVASRLFTAAVLRRIACGFPMTEEEYDRELALTKQNKHSAAAEVMDQYRQTPTSEVQS